MCGSPLSPDIKTIGEVDTPVRIEVDRTKCSGIGLCEVAAPAIFEVGDDGQTHVLVDPVSETDMASVEEAVANCPAMALSLKPSD